MARCKNCPVIDDKSKFYDPRIAVIEAYAFGSGCPDEDFDCFGGDCIQVYNEEEEKFYEYYEGEEVTVEEAAKT